LSDAKSYETEYEKLLRHIHNTPEHVKPQLGNPPKWLNEELPQYSKIRNLIQQLAKTHDNTTSKASYFTHNIIDLFSEALKTLIGPLNIEIDATLFLTKIDSVKVFLDYLLDYNDAMIGQDLCVAELTCLFFEKTYNNVLADQFNHGVCIQNFYFYLYFFWESFECVIAILLKYEKYNDIYNILHNPFHLHLLRLNKEICCSFVEFNPNFTYLNNLLQIDNSLPRRITKIGDITILREKKPIITKEILVNTDIILYQLSLTIDVNRFWFPTLYIFSPQHKTQIIWSRLNSKKYCLKLFPLFGVNSLNEFKDSLKKSEPKQRIGYNSAWDYAPNILDNIKLDEIGIYD
jgi:hypothetical protein